MKVSRHIIVSVSVGAVVSFWFNNLYAGIICLLSGVLVDSDHILEYIIEYRWRDFTFKKCYVACENNQFKKIHLVLHSIEIILVLWVFVVYTRNIYLFAGTLGYSVHLLLDIVGNRASPRSYFFIWRAVNKFSADRFLKRRCDTDQEVV